MNAGYTIKVREYEESNDETWDWWLLDQNGWPVEGGRVKGSCRTALDAAGVALYSLLIHS